jgi:hypothetical protein
MEKVRGQGVRVVVVVPSKQPVEVEKAPVVPLRGGARAVRHRQTSPWPLYPQADPLVLLDVMGNLRGN